jgi:transcriptional regulator with PAS, ATPase and Fis domain
MQFHPVWGFPMNGTASKASRKVRCEVTPGPPSPSCVILEHISEGILSVDLNKKIISFNHAAEGITGFKRNEAIGQFCFDIFRANICANACLMDKSIVSGEPQQNLPRSSLTGRVTRYPAGIRTVWVHKGGIYRNPGS